MNELRAASLYVIMLIGCHADEPSNHFIQVTNPSKPMTQSESEWRKLLTVEQYHILREAGTERPHGPAYASFKKEGKGAYHCAGCDALLFHSDQKFDSGCGWPSFYDPAKAENVRIRKDDSMGVVRMEVICARCEGHLGHVFEGEGFKTPTDKRFCINRGGLKFVPILQEESKGVTP